MDVTDETVLPGRDDPTFLPDSEPGAETNLPPLGDGPSGTAAPHVFAVGEVFWHGRYRIDAAIEGGMEAAAYRGTRLEDGRTVFVKHQWRQKSKHRASILDKLLSCDHPGCVRLLDFDASERPVEIYEWVDGVPLARLLSAGIKLSDEQVRTVVRALAEALHFLHESAGTAHRDLKPANILVTDPDPPELKLVDYGVMTLFAAGGATTFAGTKKYAPPEALRWSLPRDADLIAYDWWSLGRVVQELVDGIHPYDRIAAMFPAQSADPEALEAIWGEILSEEKRATYGRAGQVEHSTARWRPLLRGLLTTDRERRWGYDQVVRWLRGETVPDAYDAASTTDFGSVGGDVVAEVLRLSTPETWDEACRLVMESDGVIGFVRKSDNKRAQTRLREADATYDALVAAGAVDVAEEIFTTLALRAVGGDRVPLTLRGYELDVDLLLAWAAAEEPRIDRLILAFLREDVIRVLQTLDPASGAAFLAFSERFRAVADTLKRWGAGTSFLNQAGAIALCAAESRADAEKQIAGARTLFASSTIADLHRAFVGPNRSDVEAAALVFTFERAAEFRYETVATVARREREKREAAEAERRRVQEEQRRLQAAQWEANFGGLKSVVAVITVLALIVLTVVVVSRQAVTVGSRPSAYGSTAQESAREASAQAVSLVREYYDLWNRKDFSRMYPMLSSRMQNRYTYANYVRSHAMVERISVDATPGSTWNDVAVRIVSNDREVDGSITESVFFGDWYLTYEGGVMKLNSETLRQQGTSVTIAGAPSRSAPQQAAPQYRAPAYSAPAYSAPRYTAPRYTAPTYTASQPRRAAPRSTTAPSVTQLDKEIDP